MQGREYDYLIKLIIIGDPSVGKTHLLLKYSDENYQAQTHMATIGIDMKIKTITQGGKNIKI